MSRMVANVSPIEPALPITCASLHRDHSTLHLPWCARFVGDILVVFPSICVVHCVPNCCGVFTQKLLGCPSQSWNTTATIPVGLAVRLRVFFRDATIYALGVTGLQSDGSINHTIPIDM